MEKIERIVIAAGGTGGHLYPAQALAQQLRSQSHRRDVLFVSGGLGTNPYFDRREFSFCEIVKAPLISKNIGKSLKGLFNLLKGIKQSVAILKRYRPHVVVGFGSFYTVPVLLAARWLKIPIILHEANSIPGRANKWLAPLATHVGIHFPTTAPYFKNKSVEVGLPLREGYRLSAVSKEEALAYYGFCRDRRTLLICGGSQGARTINEIMTHCLSVIQKLELQVIHLTGDQNMASTLTSLYAFHQIPAVVKSFENQMQMAWRAAEGFLGRVGASTIAESIEFEVPALLIPFPQATDSHQEKNADFLVETVGSAWKLLENGLTPKKLNDCLISFHEEKQMDRFKAALRAYKQRPHQMTLCELVLQGI